MNSFFSQKKSISNISRAKALIESLQPLLEKFPKELWDSLKQCSNQIQIRQILTKQGVDIQNAEFTATQIKNGHDALFSDPDCIFILIGDQGEAAIVRDGKEILLPGAQKAKLAYDERRGKMRGVSASWKKLVDLGVQVWAIMPDQLAPELGQLQSSRRLSQKGMISRDSSLAGTGNYDKSGYLIDPNKYYKKLARLRIERDDKLIFQEAVEFIQTAQQQAMNLMKSSFGYSGAERRALSNSILSQISDLSAEMDTAITNIQKAEANYETLKDSKDYKKKSYYKLRPKQIATNFYVTFRNFKKDIESALAA